jgi:hypothetical protein
MKKLTLEFNRDRLVVSHFGWIINLRKDNMRGIDALHTESTLVESLT